MFKKFKEFFRKRSRRRFTDDLDDQAEMLDDVIAMLQIARKSDLEVSIEIRVRNIVSSMVVDGKDSPLVAYLINYFAGLGLTHRALSDELSKHGLSARGRMGPVERN